MPNKNKALETRSLKGVEVRAAKKDGFLGTIAGYAAVFNSESRDFGGWREVLAPGCFTRSLKELPDVYAFNQHDSDEVIGRASAGTLRISEDEKGLAVEIDLIDTQRNRDLLADIRAGHIDSMSFGMPASSIRAEWEQRSGYALRTIREAQVIEVSAVTFPAYEATELSARSFNDFRKETSADPLALRRAKLELAKLNQ